jgi:hypothetical protein
MVNYIDGLFTIEPTFHFKEKLTNQVTQIMFTISHVCLGMTLIIIFWCSLQKICISACRAMSMRVGGIRSVSSWGNRSELWGGDASGTCFSYILYTFLYSHVCLNDIWVSNRPHMHNIWLRYVALWRHSLWKYSDVDAMRKLHKDAFLRLCPRHSWVHDCSCYYQSFVTTLANHGLTILHLRNWFKIVWSVFSDRH